MASTVSSLRHFVRDGPEFSNVVVWAQDDTLKELAQKADSFSDIQKPSVEAISRCLQERKPPQNTQEQQKSSVKRSWSDEYQTSALVKTFPKYHILIFKKQPCAERRRNVG